MLRIDSLQKSPTFSPEVLKLQASSPLAFHSLITPESIATIQAMHDRDRKNKLILGVGGALAVILGGVGVFYLTSSKGSYSANCGYMPNARKRSGRRVNRSTVKKERRKAYHKGYRAGRRTCKR
jgi:hypothetical protein